MNILKSLCIAFSMYSKIPMPSIEWNEKNMRYAICFLPLVGAVTGAAELIWFVISQKLGLGSVCRGAVASVIPIMINGGIHMDGFIDTSDALSSYGDNEKRLEIMSDPHVGAFGIIGAIVYFALYFGFLTEIGTLAAAVIFALGFVMSRAACAVCICLIKCAKNSGLLYTFSTASRKGMTIFTACAVFAACAAAAICVNVPSGAAATVAVAVTLALHALSVKRNFGGITGDTCGRFIQQCELVTLVIAVLGGKLF